jgi:putative ABC transport system permease protein
MRAAWRAIARTPLSSAAVVLICALALATAGTIFCVARAVVLHPLAYQDPDSLAWIWATRVDRDRAFFSLPDFLEQRRDTAGLADLVAIANWGANLEDGRGARRLQGVRTTGNLFEVLGVKPAAGRELRSQDDEPTAPAIAMLSHAVWRDRFGADPAVIGQTVRLNGAPYVVVGVLPPPFLIPGSDTDVVTPLRPTADPRRTDYDTNFIRVLARLHEGTGWGTLARRMAATNARLREAFPGPNAKKTDPRVVPLATEVFGAYRLAFALLLLCGGLMLVLTAANLAHVMLARLPATERAARIRLLLGASRAHVARAMLGEPLLLTAAAALSSVTAMAWTVPFAAARIPQVPRAADARLDATAIAWIAAAALAAGLAAGALPLRRLLRNASSATPDGGRTATARSVAGKRLLVAETAICLALLSTALLALGTLRALVAADTGVRGDGVMTVRASLPATRYPAPAFDAFMTRLLDDLRLRPEIAAAGAANVLPLSGMNVRTDFEIVGHPSRSATDVPGAQNRWITPGYFDAAGIPILKGRDFTAADARGSRGVVIIDATLARQFWGTRDPIGERISMSGFAPGAAWTIVGVAGPIKHQSVDEAPTGTVYAPMAQTPAGALPFLVNGISVVARSAAPREQVAALLTNGVRSQDASIPVSEPQTLSSFAEATLAPRRLTASLASLLALTALAIGVFGIAAVTAALVVDRRREIAIRLALGASPRRVWRSVMVEICGVAAVGMAVGLASAALLHAVFARVFFTGAEARPTADALATAIVAGAALAGTALPAWRAARVDTIDVLREG